MKLESLFPSTTHRGLRERWLAGRHCVEHGDVARLGALLDVPLNVHEFVPRAAYYCTFSAFTADRQGELVPLHSISADHALQLFERGHTIQCSGAYPGSQSANAGAELCRELGIPHASASVRYIFSPPNVEDAFGWHFDTANVIAVQLSGTKRWQLAQNEDVRFPHRAGHPSQPVRGPLNDLPGFSPRGYGPRRFDKSALGDATHVEMVPGSVLFNPGGQWHRTSGVGNEGSCSVSFLFEPDSWLKLLVRGLVSTLVEDATWRAPALQITAPGTGRDEARAMLAERLESLKAQILDLTARDLLERAYESHLSRVPEDGAAWFRLDPTAHGSIERNANGSWQLSLVSEGSDTAVEIGDSLVAACQWILASECVPFSTSALLLATSPTPHDVGQDWVDRVTTLLSVFETLGALEPVDPPD